MTLAIAPPGLRPRSGDGAFPFPLDPASDEGSRGNFNVGGEH